MEFMAVPENREAYLKWLSDPLTQRYLDLTEASLRPVMKPDAMPAERYSGMMDGRYEALRLLTHLDALYEAVTNAKAQELVEDWGATDLLAHWNISPELIERAKQREQNKA